jgi:hypothetical protein
VSQAFITDRVAAQNAEVCEVLELSEYAYTLVCYQPALSDGELPESSAASLELGNICPAVPSDV